MKPYLLSALIALAVLPVPASAGIWTPTDSGTTEEITAVDYRADAMRYVTNNGKIFKKVGSAAGTQEAAFAGRQFFDIAMSPDGTKGLAAADSGKLFRFDGTAWSEVSLANSTYDYGGSSACNVNPSDGAPDPRDAAPTTNLLAVAWSSNTVAWVTSAARGQILKSTNAGAGWEETSRRPDTTCKIDRHVTDVLPVPGSDQDVFFVDDYFAGLWRTTDQLVSAGQRRDELDNCYSITFRGAIDPASPNRISALGPCDGTLHWGFTGDAGTSSNYTDSGRSKLRDIAAAPGVFVAVGDAGQIGQSFDGKTVFGQPADGALATKDWRAVDFLDGSHAVVTGIGGSMIVSDRANEMPDVVAPTVTIAGPVKATAGVATAYTANATDNGGGVGIDPNGFQWTGSGLAPTTAATATYTFPSAGTYTVRVKARDLRGNVSDEATLTVTVVKPLFAFPAKSPAKARRKGKRVIMTVKGALVPPAGLSPAQACTGRVVLRVNKGKRRIAAPSATLSSTCAFKKTIKIARKKVGKARRLLLTVSFPGNSTVAPGSKRYSVTVKRR